MLLDSDYAFSGEEDVPDLPIISDESAVIPATTHSTGTESESGDACSSNSEGTCAVQCVLVRRQWYMW